MALYDICSLLVLIECFWFFTDFTWEIGIGGIMERIRLLKNAVQEYAWGSYTAIPELLGHDSPASTPQAELWMGAHPKAPSMVKCDGVWRSLLELISKNPQDILGGKGC